MKIHPTAVISPDAKIAEGVEVGPFSLIGPSVTIGKGTVIGSHVVIQSHTDIGENNRIFQFASVGAPPQDLKYRGEETRVVAGLRRTSEITYRLPVIRRWTLRTSSPESWSRMCLPRRSTS